MTGYNHNWIELCGTDEDINESDVQAWIEPIKEPEIVK
jgi:hypothetical protein